MSKPLPPMLENRADGGEGEPESAPTRFGLSLVDLMTGVAPGTGLLAALRARLRKIGKPEWIEDARFDAGFSSQEIGQLKAKGVI